MPETNGVGSPGPSLIAGGQPFIAYIASGDVWLATADGARTARVTSDGQSSAYTDPTIASDGTIYALRGGTQLFHFDAAGSVLAGPIQLSVLENGAEALVVAPDGAHLAYVTTGFGTYVDPRFGSPTGAFIYGGTDVMTPDGTSVPNAAMATLIYPSWTSGSGLVLTDGVAISADTLGQSPQRWLAQDDGCLIPSDCASGQQPMANLTRPVTNVTGTVLAYEYQPEFGTAGRRMLSLAGPPPADATPRCLIAGQENYSDPGSFSADGSLFAFDDTVFDPNTLDTTAGQGVYVMTVDLSADDCGASSARLVAPGGQEPALSIAAP